MNQSHEDSNLFTDLNSDEANLTMGGRSRRSSRRNSSRFFGSSDEGAFAGLFGKRGRSQKTINTESYLEVNSISALNNSSVGNNNIFNFFSFFFN